MSLGVEGTIETSRVLLNEVTRLYKNGGSVDYVPDEILALVARSLQPYNLAHVYNPSTQEFTIELQRGM